MSLTPKVFGSPAVIWLVYGDLDHDDKHSNFPEVTWCEDSQFDSDVRYVRSDFYVDFHKSRWAATEKLRARIFALETLCAVAYQVVGAADGPVEVLDNLSAAASGSPLMHEPSAGLPWAPGETLEQKP